MEAGKLNGGVGGAGRVSSQNGNGVALPSHGGDRQRFYVELRPGETTIVSWKRLIKEAKACPPPLQPSSADVGEDSHDARFLLDGCYQDEQSMVKHLLSVNAEKSRSVNRAKVNSASHPKKRRKNMVKAPGELTEDYESDQIMTMKARANLAARDLSCVDVLSSEPYVKAVGSLHIGDVALQSLSGPPVIIAADKTSIATSENVHSAMSIPDASASPKYLKGTDGYVSRPRRHQASRSSVQEKRMVVCALSKLNREKGSFKQSNPLAKRLMPSVSDMKFSNNLCPKANIELPDLNTPASPAESGFSDITFRESQDGIVAAPKLRPFHCTSHIGK